MELSSVKKTVLLSIGLFVLGIVLLPPSCAQFKIYAENVFECTDSNALGVSPNPIYLSIDGDGVASVDSDIVVSITVVDPGNDEQELRNYESGYRIAWKNNNWATWDESKRKILVFSKGIDNYYSARVTIPHDEQSNGAYFDEHNVSTYTFIIETTNGTRLSNCSDKTVQVTFRPAAERNKTITYPRDCKSIDSSGSLYETHFSCYSSGSDVAIPLENVCGNENYEANREKCLKDPLAISGAALCIPCVTSPMPGDTNDEERRFSLSHGSDCIKGVDDGYPCSSESKYSCIQSSSVPTAVRCLGSNLGLTEECILSENECASYVGGSYFPMRCMRTGVVNTCAVALCEAGSYVIMSDSSCVESLSTTQEAFCIGEEGKSGHCATQSELTNLLADPAYVKNLFDVLGEDKVREAIARLGRFGLIDPGDVTEPEEPSSPPPDSSTDFGIQNCPYSQVTETGGVNFKPQQGVLAGTAEYDRQRTEHFQCISCIAAGNSWTAIGCVDVSSPEGIFTSLIRLGIGVMGGVALLRMIWLGVVMGRSEEEGKIKEAWQGILATLGGIAAVVFSVLIIRILAVNILNVVPPGFFGL